MRENIDPMIDSVWLIGAIIMVVLIVWYTKRLGSSENMSDTEAASQAMHGGYVNADGSTPNIGASQDIEMISNDTSGSPFIGSSLGRLELGEISLLEETLNRHSRPKDVSQSWYSLNAEARELLSKAPLPESAQDNDECAAVSASLHAWSSQIIGKPSRSFAEPGESTGYDLFADASTYANPRKCLRNGKTSLETPDASWQIERATTYDRPSLPVRSNLLLGMNSKRPNLPYEDMTVHPWKSTGDPWGMESPADQAPQADTNMLTPDLRELKEVPAKCEYITAGNLRILEECNRYTMNNPFDGNF